MPHKATQAWDEAQAKHFLSSVKGDALEPVYILALNTGMRQGEILGLTWKYVDVLGGMLRVEQAVQRVGKTYEFVSPKTERSRRPVPLTRDAIEALSVQRERQQAAVVHKDWPGLVFRAANGEPLNGSCVHHRFQASAKAAGLPVIRFHDLRHSCASLLLARGAPMKVVSEILGHSSIKLTADTYGHVFAPRCAMPPLPWRLRSDRSPSSLRWPG